jgi:predicted ATPase
MSVLQWLLGYAAQGMQLECNAIDLARRLHHAPTLAHALWFVCQAQVTRRDAAAVIKTADELLTLSEEHGLPQTRATALAYLGWGRSQTDDLARGLETLLDGLEMYNRLGVRSNLCLMICLLAETYFASGQHEKSMEQADLAIATSAEIGDRWCLPRIHMIRARSLEMCHKLDAAETSLRMAVDIAAAQSAKGAQLHAANSLARFGRDQGRPQQARALLAPVYGWFTEGFDTPDLKEAKALLDELPA